jgi:restriction system protein
MRRRRNLKGNLFVAILVFVVYIILTKPDVVTGFLESLIIGLILLSLPFFLYEVISKHKKNTTTEYKQEYQPYKTDHISEKNLYRNDKDRNISRTDSTSTNVENEFKVNYRTDSTSTNVENEADHISEKNLSRNYKYTNNYVTDSTSTNVENELKVKNKIWSLELIKSLEWRYFEELCSEYYKEKGYETKLTRFGADGGVDINLYKESYSLNKPYGIVQCKAWNTNKIGVKPIRELYGIMAAEQTPLGIFITSGVFTIEAKDFSNNKNLKLISGIELLNLIKVMPEKSKQKLLDKITKGDYLTPTCPSCGIKMVLRTSKKGQNIGSKFWGCKNFPRCRSTLLTKVMPEESKQKLPGKIIKGDYLTPTCPSCGIKMVLRTSKKGQNIGSKFWGCKNFPRCRSTLKLKSKGQST